MADQPGTTPQQNTEELGKRLAELKRKWSHLNWAATIVGIAVIIVTGVGFVENPRSASEEAVKRTTVVAEDAAKKSAINVVGERLPKVVTTAIDDQKLRAKEAAG